MRAVVVETLSFCKQFEFSYAYHHPSPVLTVFSDIWAETSLSLYQGASLMFWLMGRKISRLKTSLKSLYGRIIHCENFSLKSISHSLILCLYNVEEGVSADVSAWQCGTWNYIADLNQCLRCNWGEADSHNLEKSQTSRWITDRDGLDREDEWNECAFFAKMSGEWFWFWFYFVLCIDAHDIPFP